MEHLLGAIDLIEHTNSRRVQRVAQTLKNGGRKFQKSVTVTVWNETVTLSGASSAIQQFEVSPMLAFFKDSAKKKSRSIVELEMLLHSLGVPLEEVGFWGGGIGFLGRGVGFLGRGDREEAFIVEDVLQRG